MKTFLFLLSPEVVFKARVDPDNIDSYPSSSTVYDRLSFGSHLDVRAGMTLTGGTLEGYDDLGRVKVKQQPDAGNINTNDHDKGSHDGEWWEVEDSHITIYDDYRVWTKKQNFNITGYLYKDGFTAPTGNVDNPPPQANAGPARAGFIDPDTGMLELDFDASESWQFKDGVAGNVNHVVASYNWYFIDGTVSAGFSTTAAVTRASFPAGFRWIRLVVTSTTGKQHIAYRPILAVDPYDDITLPHQIVDHQMTLKGQTMRVRVFGNIDPAIYPDGTLAMIWEEGNSSYNYTCWFTGWHDMESSTVRSQREGDTAETTMSFVDMAGRLSQLPGYSQRVEYSATPTLWSETKYPSMLYYLWYLLYWHCNALDLCDFIYVHDYLMYVEYVTLGSDESNIYSQVEDLASKVCPDHHLTCSRSGQLLLVTDPLIVDKSQRPSMEGGGTIRQDECISIQMDWNRTARIAALQGQAIKGGRDYVVVEGENTIPTLFCLAPGFARGEGEQFLTMGGRIATNIEALESSEGNRYARLNSFFGPVTVTMPMQHYKISYDPARMAYVGLDIETADVKPPRFHPFQSNLYIIQQVEFSYNYAREGTSMTATLTLEAEVDGPPAESMSSPL
jgi:hypothetical protein